MVAEVEVTLLMMMIMITAVTERVVIGVDTGKFIFWGPNLKMRKDKSVICITPPPPSASLPVYVGRDRQGGVKGR